MKKYLKNFSLLIIFSSIGIFLSVAALVFCCFVLVISPLLAFHIQSLLQITVEESK